MSTVQTPILPPGPVSDAITELASTAVGQAHREEPVLPRTGGPAGNARLTAWTGLVLLVLFAVEGVTLLSIHQLLSLHVLVGALLVPPVLLKTATTGWRILRYYARSAVYKEAGPPPLVLRLLGPLVILTTIGTLASGLWLIVTGPEGRTPTLSVAGFGISWLTIHQGFVIVWFIAMTIHVLGRTVPALRTVSGGRFELPVPDVAERLSGAADHRTAKHGRTAPAASAVPGGLVRAVVVTLVVALGLAGSVVVLRAATDWTSQSAFYGGDDGDR